MLYLFRFGEIKLSEVFTSQEKVFYPSFNSNLEQIWYKIIEGMGVRGYYLWLQKGTDNYPVWCQLL